MKNRKFAVLVAAMFLPLLSGCASGPSKLSRGWDDFVNEKYSENAWVHGAVLQDILPVYPLVGLFAGLGDGLFVNPYYFWGKDAWDNRGTAYHHKNPHTKKYVPKEDGSDLYYEE